MQVERLRRHRRDTLYGILWTVIFAGPFLGTTLGGAVPVLAQVAQLSDRWYGLIQSLPALALLCQIPGVLLTERLPHRPRAVAYTSFFGRFLWIPISAIPLVFDPGPAATAAFLVLCTIAWTGWNLGAIAWNSLMADLVPRRRRGKYMGLRTKLYAASNLLSSIALAALLPKADHPYAKWIVFGIFFFASCSGLLELTAYWKAYDPPRRRPRVQPRDLLAPLLDKSFFPFLLFAFLIASSNGIVGPFLWRHFLSAESLAPLKVTLILQTSALVGTFLMAAIWGIWVDRHGTKASMAFALTLSQLPTFLWPLVTPDRWYLGAIIMFVGVAFWAGVDVSLSNRLFQIGARKGPGYFAIYNAVVALAGFGSTALGGEIAERLHNSPHITSLANSLAPYHIIFNVYILLVLLCILLRFFALLVLTQYLPRDNPESTASHVRQLANAMQSHIVGLAILPWRHFRQWQHR
jgi:MFS family permease